MKAQQYRNTYLRLEALEDVTTVPALADGGEPSAKAKLLRGDAKLDSLMSDAALPRFPENQTIALHTSLIHNRENNQILSLHNL